MITDTTESDAGSELERIHAAAAALASQLEKKQSLAEIYSALGNIYSSIGLDPVQGNIEHITVRTLAVQLEKNLDHWYKGEFPKLPNAPKTPEAPKATPLVKAAETPKTPSATATGTTVSCSAPTTPATKTTKQRNIH